MNSWSFLQQPYFGNSVEQWLSAGALFLSVLVALKVIQRLITQRLSQAAKTTKTILDDLIVEAVRQTHILTLIAVALYSGLSAIALSASLQQKIDRLMVLVLLFQAGMWINRAVTSWLGHTIQERREKDPGSATTLSALGFIGKLVLWTLIVLLALDNAGVNITALVTGLGIGGIAIALALQNILGDLFASLSIVLDKPFVIGDFIIVGEYLGTVEHIGLKTTRIRSLSGEQIIFSNSELLKHQIRNYKRMYERRVVFTLGVTYDTPYEALSRIGSMLRQLVEGEEQTRFDRAHFKEFGDSALLFEIVYYVLTPDYNTYMDIQQSINLSIVRLFETKGIGFAYPTQTVYLHTVSQDGSKALGVPSDVGQRKEAV